MRSIRALPAILVGAAATMIAHAQVAEGIFIPAPGSAMPNYFSGTNCRASGYAQVGEPIFLAQLSLNGEMVRDWALGSDPEEVPPMDFFVKVMFDSSHFANGTPVNVKYRVWTFPSGWWEGNSDPDPIVKNKLMMFEHPDSNLSPDAAPVVNGLMSGQNYVLHQINGGTWPETDYFSGLSGSNAVFYAGHGTPLSHQTARPRTV